MSLQEMEILQIGENEYEVADKKARLLIDNLIVNVVEYGIKNDGTDTTTELQALINEKGSAIYLFKKGIYYFKDIELPSNTKIIGEKDTKFINLTNDLNSLFKIIDKENISIENCYFRNGTTMGDNSTVLGGITSDQKMCIYAYNSKNIQIKNCKFDEMFWGVMFHKCSDSFVKDSKFTNCGYMMLGVYGKSDNINIENCLFDKVFSNTSKNSYMVALSETDYENGVDYPTNISILNNMFKNNLVWEAVDSHGSVGTIISNNKFFNCKYSIVLLNDSRFLKRNFNMKDIVITNNYIDLNNIENSCGIKITGSSNGVDDKCLMAKNITIANNILVNGNDVDGSNWLLTLYQCEDFIVKNNIIKTNKRGLRAHLTINGIIRDNIIESEPYAFYFTNSHLVHFENNKIKTKGIHNYVGNFGSLSNVILKNNQCFYNTWIGQGMGYVNKFANHGEPILNINNLLPTNEVVTSKNVSYKGNTNLDSSIKATTTEGSNVIVSSANVLTDLSLMQNIIIVGAGENGGDLSCVVTEYIDKNHFKISTNALTTIDNTTITKVAYTSTT